MARRRRSLRVAHKKGNLGGALLNNVLVASSQHQKSEERKRAQRAREDERQRRRWAREREQKEKRDAREAEKLERKIAKEQEQKEKEEAREIKEIEKIGKFQRRASLELEKSGFYPCPNLSRKLAIEAVDVGLTLSQIKEYLINGREDKIREESSTSLVNEQILEELREGEAYNRIITEAIENELRSEDGLKKLNSYKKFLDEVSERERAEKAQKILQKERTEYFEGALKEQNKLIFSDTLKRIWEESEIQNWRVEEIEMSQEYKSGISEKDSYIKELKQEILSFSGANVDRRPTALTDDSIPADDNTNAKSESADVKKHFGEGF